AASGGFAAYDTGTQGPLTLAAVTADWTASTAYTARSATKHGDYVRGTTTGSDSNGLAVDRSAIFECVTAGTTGTSEPTWPSDIGGQTASDNGVIWEKVTNVATLQGGYQGFRIAAALMTDGQEMYYLAIRSDDCVDQADVTRWQSGIDGM
ncbi:MAG: hypothetical protein ACYTFQ_20865, partial [Planctomycetota bacterium]